MVYFTDMLLVPSDGDSGSEELRRALNGSGMIRCAQVAAEPDLVIDWARSENEPEYATEIGKRVKSLMDERQELDYETGGAWGGPGGFSEAWGISKHEPEVTTRLVDGEVIVRVFNQDPETEVGDILHDWMVGNVGPYRPEDGLVWDVRSVEGRDDTYSIYWKEDPDWKPEYDGPEPDDFDY